MSSPEMVNYSFCFAFIVVGSCFVFDTSASLCLFFKIFLVLRRFFAGRVAIWIVGSGNFT